MYKGFRLMTIENNKRMVRKFLLELFGRWKFELVDEIIHDDYELTENSVTITLQTSNKNGKQGFDKRIRQFKKSFPNLKYGIIKIIAEDDSVIAWWAMTATQADEIYGFSSKGQTAKIFGTNHFIFKDGKIISNTVNFDSLSFLIQLGHIALNSDQEDLVMQYLGSLERMDL